MTEMMSEYLARAGAQVMVSKAEYERLLAYENGYAPSERLPELYQNVTAKLVAGGWEAVRLEGQWWASYTRSYSTDEIDRWYPIGGE